MRVAVLGLGRMGAPIAERLLDAGHELSVWNRSPGAMRSFGERGVRTLSQPKSAWEHADVCITMLADGDAVEAVTVGDHGLLRDALPGRAEPSESKPARVIVDMSTISAETSARIAGACEQHGVALLRAPVSGNPSVVIAGNLGIIVSGARSEFDRLAEMLRDVGPNVFYVGSGEQARIVKLALNLMIAGTAELMAEALVLGEKHGIDRATMLEVMGGSAIGSPFVKYKTEALVADDYSSTFTVSLMAKDLSLVQAAAREVHVPLALAERIQPLIEECIARGMGDLDFMALLPRLRREVGLE